MNVVGSGAGIDSEGRTEWVGFTDETSVVLVGAGVTTLETDLRYVGRV